MVVKTVQSADGTTIAFERSGDGPHGVADDVIAPVLARFFLS
jgi:hypothetical protein